MKCPDFKGFFGGENKYKSKALGILIVYYPRNSGSCVYGLGFSFQLHNHILVTPNILPVTAFILSTSYYVVI